MVIFVILHYLSYDETKHSVDSILKNVNGKKKIIIVDNCSPNNSFESLKNNYEGNKDVIILHNNKNLGFAKGNNVGYNYAIKHFSPNFIVVLNNDVEINDKNFINKINDFYKKEKFAVLSPDIFSTYSKVHQSPKRNKSYTYIDVQKNINKYKKRNNSKILIPLKCLLKEIKPLKKIAQYVKFKRKKIDYSKKHYNVPLHGACFIFSPIFISKRKYCFNPNTYMYWESEILDYECQKENLLEIYNPDLKVYHHHSISSTQSYNTELKRERFTNKNVYQSLLVLKKIMEENNEK